MEAITRLAWMRISLSSEPNIEAKRLEKELLINLRMQPSIIGNDISMEQINSPYLVEHSNRNESSGCCYRCH
jgi:hypothetical protein